jgi:hypothetical protein
MAARLRGLAAHRRGVGVMRRGSYASLVCARTMDCNTSPSSFFSSDCSEVSALQSAYDGMINSKEGFKRDAFQQNAIDSLSDLQRSLASLNVKQAKGCYMHGGVGSGKTFVMDLFYDTAPTVKKRRMHFTSFMLEMHKRMAAKQKEREAQISGGFLKRILPKIHDDIGGTADSSTERSFSLFGTKIVLSSGDGEYNAVDEDNEDPLPVIAKEIGEGSPAAPVAPVAPVAYGVFHFFRSASNSNSFTTARRSRGNVPVVP